MPCFDHPHVDDYLHSNHPQYSCSSQRPDHCRNRLRECCCSRNCMCNHICSVHCASIRLANCNNWHLVNHRCFYWTCVSGCRHPWFCQLQGHLHKSRCVCRLSCFLSKRQLPYPHPNSHHHTLLLPSLHSWSRVSIHLVCRINLCEYHLHSHCSVRYHLRSA